MAHGDVLTTDEQIDAAIERSKHLPELPTAIAAEYDSRLELIVLRIDDGRRLVIPREQMQGLENATEAQLSDIQIFGGTDVAWPQLDVDHYLPSLLEGRYGSEKWMRSLERKQVAA
ncbi:MAG TPA: DUF2442 domain-containing protein [Acidobacteriaceae bacterium]|nr:DUF2442 domain-containing protein [Acidobacteriaceae bacterium]